ncbi:DUF3422 domain-containing protein [Rhizobium lusitanum]|uniref:DUF3422 domain-containing protein n=1 Tax=Rhizobium lusitanum TaxID=293958 RepID=UPI00195B0A71|nr:DUF3422 domain-containing protein [Rhizobium lusitanum]MBM7046217.1 DUF3422 domain-containing protein [Rhizobium lusitanum]
MPTDHPMRRQLHDEFHSRPSLYFDGPAVVRHHAFYFAGVMDIVPANLLALKGQQTREGNSGIVQVAGGQIKWEVHTEFVSVTQVVAWSGDIASLPVSDAAWQELLEAMPGQRICNVEVLVVPVGDYRAADLLEAGSDLVASAVGGRDAEVWSTFRLGKDHATRIVLLNRHLNSYRTGRMVRRLLEIEDYRMMALLALPLSKAAFRKCVEIERELQSAIASLRDPSSSQQAVLAEIAKCSAEMQDLSIKTRERFSATAAYADLVFRRVQELREERIEGHQRVGVFIDRRFGPAVRSCEQADRRVENTAVHVARTTELLRTSVQVELEQQNASLLQSMERRLAIQTRLQQAVEGLSVFAIGYYALSILKYMLEGVAILTPAAHWTKAVIPIAVPIILLVVWLSVRRVHTSIKS